METRAGCVAVGVAEDEKCLKGWDGVGVTGEATERDEDGKWREPMKEKRCAKRGMMMDATCLNKTLSCWLDMEWYTLLSGMPGA